MDNYQGKHVTRRSRRIPLSVWLAYLLVASLIATGVTFSGYVTEAKDSDTARVAKFEVTETGHQFMDVSTSNLYPGAVVYHTIQVKNKSEVAIRYTISPTRATNNLPLTLAVVDKGDKTGQVITNGGELAPGENGTYYLKIQWPADMNSVEYAGQVDLIRLGLRAEQID